MLMSLTIVSAAAQAAVRASEVAGWRIVLPRDAIPSEHYAAAELQRLLAAATGEEPAIQARDRGRSRVIFVGAGTALQRRYPGWTATAHGDEGFRIVIDENHIAIAGGRPRGTLYGVYEFAERYLGVRFLTAEHTHIPSDPGRLLPHADFEYAPPFSFRWAYWDEVNSDPAFAARLRNNVITHDEHLGGATPQLLISHSIQDQVPVAEHGASHPEYFALVDGVRTLSARHAPQVDPTHPGVQALVTEAVREELRRHPERRVVSVSPTDNGDYDEGWRSLAWIRREGTPMAPHLMLVNAVARDIAPAFPQARVGTLAYWSTRQPPRRLRPLPTVQIQLASFECSLLHALDDPAVPVNAAFMGDLEGWRGLTGAIYLWHYAANLGQVDVPIANFHTFAPSFRAMRDHGVRGIFSQGNGRCPAGEFADLKAYLVSHLLWNPDADAEALMAEFLDLHYGPAADAIAAAIAELTAAQKEGGGTPMSYPMVPELGLTAEVAAAFHGHLEAGYAAAPEEPYQSRVAKLRLMGYKALLVSSGRVTIEDERVFLAMPAEADAWLEAYTALAERFGMDRNMEFEPLEHWLNTLAANRAGAPVVRIEDATWRLTLVPAMSGRIVEWLHKPSGSDLLTAAGSPMPNFVHGTAQWAGLTGLGGLRGPFEVAEHEPDAIRLVRTVEGEARLEWTLVLAPEAVRSEAVVTNLSSETRRKRLQFEADVVATGRPVVVADGNATRLHLEQASVATPAGAAVRIEAPGMPAAVGLAQDPGQFEGAVLTYAPVLDTLHLRLPSARFWLAPGGRAALRLVLGLGRG